MISLLAGRGEDALRGGGGGRQPSERYRQTGSIRGPD